MTADLFDTLAPEIPRDRWQRPLIVPANGGKPVGYVRASTFANTLDDAGGLVKWKARMVALGIGAHEDLAAVAAGLTYGDPKLDEIIETAHDRAGGNAKANYGTALHLYTDPGAPAPPARMASDVDAYHAHLALHGATVVEHDRFIVNDALGVAGTFDAILAFTGLGNMMEDRKTGGLHMLAHAIQLAVYAGGVFYDLDADGNPVRTPLPDVDQNTGIIAHVPAGKGECVFYDVDLNLGRAACDLALDVREWRKRKDIGAVRAATGGLALPVAPVVNITAVDNLTPVALDALIALAPDLSALHALWETHQTEWTPEHSELAKARKALIAAGMA